MSSLATPPASRYVLELQSTPDDMVRNEVWGLLSALYPPGAFERRREQRYPFPRLLTLAPADDQGTPLGRESLTAAGKQISENGLSFFHPTPLAYRLVVAAVDKPDGTRLGFLVDVDWCRFTRHGWYESGGRILKCVPAPARNG